MLITCPECQLQVSDKALACPHCGFPLQIQQEPTSTPKSRKRNKRRRLPNGFGQITEIKNRNLRRPFRAMVTIAKTDEGKPICKLLQPQAYFETYNDAYQALLDYNKNPFDLDKSITMQALYDKWMVSYSKKVCSGNIITTRSAWKYAHSIYNMSVREVRIPQLKNVIVNGQFLDKSGKRHITTPSTQNTLKKTFNLLFDFAVENELTDKNYARLFKIPGEAFQEKVNHVIPHVSFTDEEMRVLWNALGSDPTVELMLVQCYCGWRASELLHIKFSDIDLENRTMVGGSKTEAGQNRVVPIHPRIFDIVEKRYLNARNNHYEYPFYLPSADGSYRYPRYEFYARHFNQTVEALGIAPHHSHDCRKTFVTHAKEAGVDEYAIKRLVGHRIPDLTERVYTDRSIEWLRTELEKIP